METANLDSFVHSLKRYLGGKRNVKKDVEWCNVTGWLGVSQRSRDGLQKRGGPRFFVAIMKLAHVARNGDDPANLALVKLAVLKATRSSPYSVNL